MKQEKSVKYYESIMHHGPLKPGQNLGSLDVSSEPEKTWAKPLI